MPVTVLDDVSVVDVLAGRTLPGRQVVVEGDRIAAVRPAGTEAEPGAAPFVSVGAQVSEGQTLLIIEAMKTMNHIPAPKSGTVKRILVEDGSPIEYGAPLMIIE